MSRTKRRRRIRERDVEIALSFIREKGEITTAEASHWGIVKLSPVIHRLRGEGWPLRAERVSSNGGSLTRYFVDWDLIDREG